MSGLKGFPTTQKIVNDQYSRNDFNTLQPSDVNLRQNLDTISRVCYRIGSLQTAASGTGATNTNGSGWVIKNTSTLARPGDVVRFESGSAVGIEIPIIDIPDVNTIKLAASFSSSNFSAYAPASGDTFYILRYATQRSSSSGTSLTSIASLNYIQSARNDYSLVNVTTGAWVQLIATTSADASKITIFDSSGYAMELGIGAALSEVRKLLIPPGGLSGMIELQIPLGSRISIRAIGAASIIAGEVDINLFG